MLWPLAAMATPAIVQHTYAGGTGVMFVQKAFSNVITAGDEIVAICTEAASSATITFSDTSGDTPTSRPISIALR